LKNTGILLFSEDHDYLFLVLITHLLSVHGLVQQTEQITCQLLSRHYALTGTWFHRITRRHLWECISPPSEVI